MSHSGSILEKSANAEVLIERREESNYFYGGQDFELDVADFISKSAPKQIKHNPFLDSYIFFAKAYGAALILYGLFRLIYILYTLDGYLQGGLYYYTFHHFFVIVNDLAYFTVAGYSIYTAHSCTVEKVSHGYNFVVNTMLALFVLDSFDIAYLAHCSKVYDQYWEWLCCIILYLFAYVNHYDFHKKLKKCINFFGCKNVKQTNY